METAPMRSPSNKETPSLVNNQQVRAFDALASLASLDITHNLSPQLIVIGDQSVGKSSVLEALARFHFPISEELSTRCPIKLILRKSPQQLLNVRIELSNSNGRRDVGPEMQKWISGIDGSSPEDLANPERLITDAMSKLGLPSRVSPVTIGGPVKQFTEDSIVIEKRGPNLPLLNLMDLPGLFQAQSSDQNEDSRIAVDRMVKEQLELKTNVVLLIVDAKTPIVNQTVMRKFQEASKNDPELADRVIGVITHPDQAGDHLGKILDYVNGGTVPLRNRWYVIKNQNKQDRTAHKSLDDRDREEEEFFNNSHWQMVESRRKGIRSLRIALKDALWFHTQKALPSIRDNIERKISQIEAEIKPFNPLWTTDSDRRKYLVSIAVKFESLTTRAINGSYENDSCSESHAIGESRQYCLQCKGFFPVGMKNPSCPEDQMTKLRSRIRNLNMDFAKAMRRYGKTDVVGKEDQTTTISMDEGPAEKEYPEDLPSHYKLTKSNPISRKLYEEGVAEMIRNCRGLEPGGEVNSSVYRDLFIGQSSRWDGIAEEHLIAVFEATKDFINLAINYVCPESNGKIRQALWTKFVDPSLESLRKEAYNNLRSLLDCRVYAITAFFDSFSDVFTLQEQAKDLEARLNVFGLGKMSSGSPDEIIMTVRSGLKRLIDSSVSSPWVNDHIKNAIIHKCIDVLSQAFSATRKPYNEKAIRVELSNEDYIETRHLDAARVVEAVETYYKNAMVAFVAYVNALVVENVMVRKLPATIFNQESIKQADQEVINEIVAEDEDKSRKREQNREILDRLKEYLAELDNCQD